MKDLKNSGISYFDRSNSSLTIDARSDFGQRAVLGMLADKKRDGQPVVAMKMPLKMTMKMTMTTRMRMNVTQRKAARHPVPLKARSSPPSSALLPDNHNNHHHHHYCDEEYDDEKFQLWARP